jgi:hypothetical protein
MNKARFKKLLGSVREGGAILRGEVEPSRTFERSAPKREKNPQLTWAVCITNEDEALIARKLYLIETVGADGARVIDENGEAALVPLEYFVPLSLPSNIEKKLTAAESRT